MSRLPASLALLWISVVVPLSAQVLWLADFSKRAEGDYGEAAARADFGPFIQYANVPAGRARIKADAELGRKVLEVKYPKGCVGPDACAAQVRSNFAARQDAWMRYRVKFSAGFDWQKGGKLPGLCGGKCNTGCVDVSGKDGWSARLMWHDDAKLVQYLYYPDGSSNCGSDFAYSSPALSTGRWYEIINQVVLNTPGTGGAQGKHDGILRAWVDGKLVLDRKDMRFRDVGTVTLNQFYFSTFHGGDSPDWGPGSDSYASYADIVVSSIDPRSLTSALGDPAGPRSEVAAPHAAWDKQALSITSRGQAMRVALSDAAGRILRTETLPAHGSLRWPASSLPPGPAFLLWSSESASGRLALAHFP